MGRDKALIEIDGEPLWQRQMATLSHLRPEQLMVSGPPRIPSPSFRAERSEVEESRGASLKFRRGDRDHSFTEAPRDPSTAPAAPLVMTMCAHGTIADELENAGPLGGMASALRHCAAPLLVVLAVDLPRMTTTFLQELLALCSEGRGVVPRGLEFF